MNFKKRGRDGRLNKCATRITCHQLK